MYSLNNKGQSLVMFIIIIPLFVLMFTLVYDVGSAIYEKNKLSNTSYMVIDYGLDKIENISENELVELVMKNISDLKYISVVIEDNTINVVLSKDVKGIIGKMFGFNLIETNSYYEGSLVDGKKKIERIK